MTDLTAANRARLNKALDKMYYFTGINHPLSLGDYLILNKSYFTGREKSIANHSDHRINLEYKETEDKITYTLWSGDEGISIPKIVYDTLDYLPERINDQRF